MKSAADGEMWTLKSQHQLTCYCNLCGDGGVHVGDIVGGETGVWTTLTLCDIVQAQHWACSVHNLASESPLKLSWGT